MIALALALVAAVGVHLLCTRAEGPAPEADTPSAGLVPLDGLPPGGPARWLAQAGLEDVAPREFVAVSATIAAVGGLLAFALLGTLLPAVLVGIAAGAGPGVGHRSRRRHRREVAQEAWPRIIEEIRILTGAVGRSIPQALFEAGRRAPVELRGAFATAHREWLLTTDFTRTLAVLKERLADPTADAACETLLVAHEVGGADLDRRLEALADDRMIDLQGRRDARAQQAGVRFARRFVLVVPLGMGMVGMSVGDGRSAYQTPQAQAVVLMAFLLILGCWAWAGRILQLPAEDRVFDS